MLSLLFIKLTYYRIIIRIEVEVKDFDFAIKKNVDWRTVIKE